MAPSFHRTSSRNPRAGGAALALLTVALAGNARAAITIYHDEADFAAASSDTVYQTSPQIVCTGFGACPRAIDVTEVYSTPFPALHLTTNPGAFINYTDKAYYSQTFAHDFFTEGYDPTVVNHLHMEFPFPGTITAIGIDFTTFVGQTITIGASDPGDAETYVDTAPPALFQSAAGPATTEFVGFTSDAYLNDLDLSLSATGDSWIVSRFYIGSTDEVALPAETVAATASEPGSWALSIAGLGLVGGLLRRRARESSNGRREAMGVRS